MTAVDRQHERVLSTLNADGSRRWLKPKPSRGRFWRRRRAAAWLLIGLFTLLPYLKINNRPVILLDVARREFSLFGGLFYPTDTLLLALFVVGVFLTVFLLTALFGRVWCGWACPQTVYMEFVYRPIERFFEGEPGRTRKRGAWRTPAKYAVYLLVSMFLAHTFLAYFVGVEELARWVRRSPAEHPASFLIMASVTALMMFDFCFFREQTCIVACPYGRFQSVLLDRRSLVVAYDPRRGEPRGKAKRAATTIALPVVSANGKPAERTTGDCVDCFKCVATCPTGIDIRDGLQMECIHCTQCIDACDEVMERLGRPRGLIRYGSQAGIEGERARRFRPRLLIYPCLLTAVVAGILVSLSRIEAADVTVLRGPGLPFNVLPTGEVSNQAIVRVRNRTRAEVGYEVGVPGVEGARVIAVESPLRVAAGALRSEAVSIVLPADAVTQRRTDITLRVTGTDGYTTETAFPFFSAGREAGTRR
ncbi:MAG: cytochrome c oxidase accessory protein CcoG [Leptolyngbya sp. PLA2]|nr:cytochrome c oxidase accessory protein CcoG [Leptolyngbya sp.]MCE7970975.1 cytochrome c oxidase accessory protein CcoG [Leptolyngbya sp. PL-A2]MCZ7631954.1 cytochrome c oxidase accessory protein CcoG [Phycisphaerales bacterium]MDL1905286.1 cytochrome c oxidase accessory protein CcoG [Synechococcales cyanobacterium CNB]GIK20241.1 MAG: cytochrome c oxidase accessory protein CcoG [Planctomycetota bacterium]